MSKRVALYTRVSTLDQQTGLQRDDLRRFAESRHLGIVQEYSDSGISGVKRSRPGLDALMSDARKRKFDMILVWRFDRFARSTKHLLDALEEFQHLGIDFVSYSENLDTSSPMGKAMFTIIGAIAALERDIIKERVTAGVRRAMKSRSSWGRKRVEQVNPAMGLTVARLKKAGWSYREIAKETGLSVKTAWRIGSGGH